MVIVPGRWAATRHRYGWTLVEHYTSKDKHGNDAARTRERYFAHLEQCLRYILDVEVAPAGDLMEAIEILNRWPRSVAVQLQEASLEGAD